jgi:hypothetical protein
MSTVVLDTITGKSTATTITIGSTPVVSASANSMTIRGEGSNQTSIQQGLGKSWLNLDGTGTVGINGSFNISSVTDDGTGDYDPFFTTNMANTTYAGTGTTLSGPGDFCVVAITSLATGGYRLLVSDGASTNEDADPVQTHILGDLA